MNSRRIRIVELLLKRNEQLDFESLANHFDITTRMIRNDIESLNDFFIKYSLSINQNDSRLIVFNANETIVYDILDHLTYYQYKLDREERMNIIVMLLLLSDEALTIEEIANFLEISRTTCISDLQEVKKNIQKEGLDLIPVTNQGQVIVGDKKLVRNYILKLLNTDLSQIVRFFNQPKLKKYISTDVKLLTEDLRAMISDTEHKTKNFLKRKSRLTLLYILIFEIIKTDVSLIRMDYYQSDFEFTNELLYQVDNYLEKKLTDDSKSYLENLIDGLKFSSKNSVNKNILNTQVHTRKFIENMSKQMEINFNEDYLLLENLSTHISSVIESKIDEKVEFRPSSSIGKLSIDIKGAILKNVYIIEEFANRKLNEVEIEYLILYFYVSLERMKNNIKNVNILIVCNSGVVTNQMLVEEIRKNFGNLDINTTSTYEMKNIVSKNDIDLILSTIPLTEDYGIIQKHINAINEETTLKRIGDLIDSIKLSKINKEFKKKDINKVKMSPNYSEKHKDEQKKLSELLKIEHITLDVEVENWQSAVRQSGSILLKNGIIEPEYIEAMIRSIEDYGPYIVISKGVAAPHASHTDGVNEVGISLTRLKEPVKFGVDGLDPIDILFCISPIDDKQHLRAFFSFVNLIKNDDVKDLLRNAETNKEILDIIEKYE